MRRESERGAITLFVIIAGFSFITFLIAMLTLGSVKRQTQAEATKQARYIYSSGDANSIYNDYFGEGAIPIYTVAQLEKMCSGEDVIINENGGKIYNFSSSAVYVLMNDLAFTYPYEGNWGLPNFEENGRFEGNGKTIAVKNLENEIYYYNKENNYRYTNQFIVSFNASGGEGGQRNNVTATFGQAMPTISTIAPTRVGYTFAGWYDVQGQTGGLQYYTAEGASARTFDKTGNLALYAKWVENSYTVTFDANGGSVGTASKTVTYGGTYGDLPTPTKTGYTFAGWAEKNLLNIEAQQKNPSNTAREYTQKRTFEFDSSVKGLAYNNYFIPANVTDLSVNGNVLQFTTSSGYGIGYPIQAKANTAYTLSYNADSDSLISSVMYYKEDGTFISNIRTDGGGNKVVNFTTPSDIYYLVIEFCAGGSNTRAVFQNIQLEYGSEATEYQQYHYVASNTTVTQSRNHTITAKWTANTYTLVFNANSGTGTMANQAMKFGQEKSINSNTFTRTGYTFYGWSTEKNLTSRLLFSDNTEKNTNNDEWSDNREFIQYADLAPYIDQYGTGAKYRLEFDIKSEDTSNNNSVEVYFQNGSTSKYSFQRNVNVSSNEWTHYSLVLDIALRNASETRSMLAFYGTYNTGNKPIVKNVRFYVIQQSNLLYSDDTEKGPSSNEFLQYADLAPYIDELGTNVKYRLELDIKSSNTSNQNTIQAYFQNGNGSKYHFEKQLSVSSDSFTHHNFTFNIRLQSTSETQSILAFYGTYNTGNKPIVKNVRFYVEPTYSNDQTVNNLTTTNNAEITLYAQWIPN